MSKPQAMAGLADAISKMMSPDEIRNKERRPNMSDRFRHLFLDRVQNRDEAGLQVVRNQEKATIRIYDVIGWPFIMAEDVAAELDKIEADDIEVQINSPGGDAWDGIAIFNSLRTHSARVTTRVDGVAASAASIVAQAGDNRIMLSGSQMMIHQAWMLTIGPEQEHLVSATMLNKVDANLAGLYAERSGGDTDEFAALMEAETWFNADDAVEAGLADETVTPETPPKDQAPKRFTDQFEAAIAAVEQVTSETENVVTFRAEQGKPPLSDDAVALVSRAKAALKELTGVAESTSTRRDELLARVADARAELDIQTKQLEKYQ